MNALPSKFGTEQLTSLRFFAALSVVVAHLSMLRETDNPLGAVARVFFREGFIGVGFFFVLSGFILCAAYDAKLKNRHISFRYFWALRLARVFPLHWLILAPLALWGFSQQGVQLLPAFLSNLVLIQSWIPFPAHHYGFNFVAWSLSTELFFYLLFPMLIFRSSIGLLMLAGALLLGIAGLMVWFLPLSTAFDASISWEFYVFPVPRLLEFVAGILVYRFVQLRPNLGARMAFQTGQELLAIALLFLVIYLAYVYQIPKIVRAQLLYAPFLVYLVYVFGCGQGLLSQALRAKVWVYFGKISFVVFLIHYPVLGVLKRIAPMFLDSYGVLAFSGLVIAVTLLISALIDQYFDQPVQRWVREKLTKRYAIER
jgi:peptidoglycan/LPS O-acetylase OafA/YrhL